MPSSVLAEMGAARWARTWGRLFRHRTRDYNVYGRT